MKISARQIGDGAPVYVIAEIGVNHEGLSNYAMRLIEAAADAGADAVKFQVFRADLLMSREARLAAYQQAAGESDPFTMLARLELSAEKLAPLVARAHDLGMQAIATVFSVGLVREAGQLPWDAYKTASPDIVHRPLLEALMATGRPLIVSTGAADLAEVERAAGWLTAAHERLAMLQCVSCYPTKPADAAVRAMESLRQLPGLRERIGYSDHTLEVDTGEVAAHAGACILEKHLTYDKRAQGPDHAASLEPHEFRRYVELARDASVLRLRVGPAGPAASDERLGPPIKRVLACERDVRAVSRQSITARRSLPAGHTLGADDLTYKRPGTGLPPWRVAEIIGKRLLRNVDTDMPLSALDILGAEGMGP